MTELATLARDLAEGRLSDDMFVQDAVIWQNIEGGRTLSPQALQAAYAQVAAAVEGLAFEDVRTAVMGDVILVERVNVVTVKDGSRIRVPVCLVVSTAGGRIVRLNEYLSESRMAALFAALTP